MEVLTENIDIAGVYEDENKLIARKELKEFDNSEEGQELTALKALAEQGEAYAPDWKYGAQLINEDYFEEAMDEMLEDCGDIPKDIPCYLDITVNYDMLKWDYTELDFDGETYYIR